MPARKRKRSATRSSGRPSKRRRTNSNNTRNTNDSLQRRSARLQARNARKENRIIVDQTSNNNNDNNNNNNNIPLIAERRRSSRIARKIEQKKQRQEYERKSMDIDDITESIQEIDVSPTPNAHNKNKSISNIYKPLTPPQRPLHFNQACNDYVSLQNRMELGQISAAYFRETIFENELNEFWDNDIKQNKYSLTSVSPVFDGVASTDKKINAFRLHDTELFSFSGSKDGFIGITNFSQLQFPYQTIAVKVHEDRVSDIRTCIKRPLHLYTSGFDGRVKVLDLTRIPTFQSIQIDENELNHFNDNNQYFGDTVIDNRGVVIHGIDIKNGGRELYAVDNDGMLLFCDLRTHETSIYPIAEKKIATIRISPFNDNYFVITENKKKLLQCWDFRMIHAPSNLQCVHQRKFTNAQKNINFSSDGTRLLTCGRDDFIRVYDNPLNTFYQHDMKMKHCNNTGIWVCDFKPVFHPKYPQIITTGNMERKGVDVLYFGKNGKMRYYNINAMSKVKSIYTFGQFHSRYSEFLFGVTYDKIVRFSNIDLNEEIHDDDDM